MCSNVGAPEKKIPSGEPDISLTITRSYSGVLIGCHSLSPAAPSFKKLDKMVFGSKSPVQKA